MASCQQPKPPAAAVPARWAPIQVVPWSCSLASPPPLRERSGKRACRRPGIWKEIELQQRRPRPETDLAVRVVMTQVVTRDPVAAAGYAVTDVHIL